MSEKTEEPTAKKLRDARKRGEVPKSRELSTAAVLLATTGAAIATGEQLVASLSQLLKVSFDAVSGAVPVAPTDMLLVGATVGAEAALPLVLCAMVAGTLASFLQVGALVSFEAVAPKAERIDPIKGFKNLFTQKQFIELLKSILKIGIIGYVAYTVLRDGTRGVVSLASRDGQALLDATGALGRSLLLKVGGAIGAIAILDVFYQRWRFRRDQRMSKDEVKREYKDAEGDPHAKQERERMHREIIEHSTLEDVRGADVLVVNPTHLAIALVYDEDSGHDAPEILAKGQDALAKRMIEVARAEGIPIMRDVPLARSLYDMQLGEEIPESLYEAVAAVLRAAFREREDATAGGAR